MDLPLKLTEVLQVCVRLFEGGGGGDPSDLMRAREAGLTRYATPWQPSPDKRNLGR